MLDGAFKQEASNIIEDTFSACDAWKSRMFEEINNYTACALGSEKYIKRRPRFSSTRIFVNGFWQFDPKFDFLALSVNLFALSQSGTLNRFFQETLL